MNIASQNQPGDGGSRPAEQSWHAQSVPRLLIGGALLLYGLLALLAGRAYLPFLWRDRWAMTGMDSVALSLAYVLGGLYFGCSRHWFNQYVAGLSLGAICTLYGAYALLSGAAYLPGLQGAAGAVTGAHGRGVAVIYLVGGIYLICRLFLEPRVRRESYRLQLYFLQNVLLLALVAALVYVLLKVGAAAA